MWPLLLDMTKEESMQSLRNLELEAFAHLVSALRAQGPLDPDKKKLLKDTGVALNITQDRHKAEIRRAVNDEKLNTIAYHVTGLSESLDDWAQEGRRTVPLLPRTAPQTAYSAIADEAAENANQTNTQLPLPACTERKRTQSMSQMMPETKPLAFRIPEPPKVAGMASGMEQESKKRKLPIENSSLAQHLLGPAKINRPQHFYRQRPKSMMKDQMKFKPQSPQQMIVPQQKMPLAQHSSPGINGPKINVVQNITLSSSSVPAGCVVGGGAGGGGGAGEETIEQIQNEINNYTVQKPAEPLMPSCSNENQAPQVAAAAAARAARLATPPTVKPTTANFRPSTGILPGGPSSSSSSSSLNASCMSIGGVGGGGGGRESPKPCGGIGNQIKMMPSKKSTRPSPLAQKLIVVSNAAAAAHHQQAMTAAAAAAASSASTTNMHHHHHHHHHPHHHQNSSAGGGGGGGGGGSGSILQKTLSIPLVKNISMRSLEKFKIVTTSSPQVAAAAAAAAAAGCNAVNSATFKHKVVTVKAGGGGGQGQSLTVGGCNAPKKVIPLSQILTSKGGIKVLPIGGKIVGKTTTTTASSPLYIVNTMGGMGQNKSTISTHPPTSFTATATTATPSTGATVQSLPTPAPPPPPPPPSAPSPPEVQAAPSGSGKENGKSSVLGDIMKASGVTTDDFDTQIEEFRIPTNNHLCNNNNVTVTTNTTTTTTTGGGSTVVAMEIGNNDDQAPPQQHQEQQPPVQVMEEEAEEVVESEKSDDEHSQNVIIIQEDAESKTQIESTTPPHEFSETKAPALPPQQQQQQQPPNVIVQVENFDSISTASAAAAEN